MAPILHIIPYESKDWIDTLTKLNEHPDIRTVAILSKLDSRTEQARTVLEISALSINRPAMLAAVGCQPLGGQPSSGHSLGSPYAFLPYVQEQLISEGLSNTLQTTLLNTYSSAPPPKHSATPNECTVENDPQTTQHSAKNTLTIVLNYTINIRGNPAHKALFSNSSQILICSKKQENLIVSIRTTLYCLMAGLLLPLIALVGTTHFSLDGIQDLARQQATLVTGQGEAVNRQAQQSLVQDEVFKQQAALLQELDTLRATGSELEFIKLTFAQLQNKSFAAALSRRVSMKDEYEASLTAFQTSISESTVLTAANRERLSQDVTALNENMKSVSSGLGRRNKRPAVKLFLEDVLPSGANIEAFIDDLIKKNLESYQTKSLQLETTVQKLKEARNAIATNSQALRNASDELGSAADETVTAVSTAIKVMFSIVLVLVPASFLIGGYIANLISRPIQTTTSTIGHIAENLDLSQALTPQKAEFGRLVVSFESLIERVKKTLKAAWRSTDQFNQAADDLKNTVTTLESLVNEQGRSVDRLAQGLKDTGECSNTTEGFLDDMRQSGEQCLQTTDTAITTVRESASAVSFK